MYSFDVFDTLITRNTANPVGIFALMQDKLEQDKAYSAISAYIKSNFFYLRIHAEELARVNYGVTGAEDVTLEQIYEALGMTGCLTATEEKLLMELERTIEYENVVGIEQNIEKVKQLIEEGKKVVLISDMYLDQKTIKDMLIKVDAIFADIPLYVSAAYKKGKYTNNLYNLVKECENADFEQWVHCGDNLYSDIEMAKRIGIKPDHFAYESLMACEKKVLENKADDVFVQLTIGAARNARLEHRLSGPAAIGCSIGGVILFPYVWWILQESLKKGIKRLYFIARDGFVLKKLADLIIEQYQYEISTHYIYGSRKAWRMPSVSEKNCDVYKLIGWSHAFDIKNVGHLAEVLQIPVHEFIRFLPMGYQDIDKELSPVVLFLLIVKLNKNNAFKKYLCLAHKKTRARVIAYLKQELDFSDDAFAFVDLAGGGLTQGCLAEIMSDFYDKQIQTFFFKLDRMHVMDNNIYYNFIPSFLHLNLIVEMLCRAPHGQTEGYIKNENGKFVPSLKAGEEKALIEHGFNEYLSGMELFIRKYIDVLKNLPIQVNKIDVLLKYMEYITKTPNEEVLNFFAGMPNNVTGREKKVIKFAPVLSRKQLRYLYVLRMDWKEPIEKFYLGSNLEYSLLRCSQADRRKIEFYQKNREHLLDRFERLNQKSLRPKRKNYSDLANEFPCELLAKRIVLYAAGNLGQALYKRISKLDHSRVVQWVDKDYDEYQKQGLPVVNIVDIGKIEYDQIVIAIANQYVGESIRKSLKINGVPNEKIVGVNLSINWV